MKNKDRRLPDIERAKRQISRVQFTVNTSGCFIPLRYPNRNGYINTNFKKKQIHLHRLVAYAYLGLDLKNHLQLSLHKNSCHDRRCFNKDHLYVGNHSDNTRDSVLIGTHHEIAKKLTSR